MSGFSNSGPVGAVSIPIPVIAVMAEVFADWYTHSRIDCLMEQAGIPGEVPSGNKVDKVRSWLKRANASQRNPLECLGKILCELMEVGTPTPSRKRVEQALAQDGLAYLKGSFVVQVGVGLVARTLEDHIRSRDMGALRTDFERIAKNIDSDPASATTSTCSLLESLFRIYLEVEHLPIPADKSLKSLWIPVRNHLKLDPSAAPDEDVRKIFGGLGSVVDGIASLRTHKGSAHGHGNDVAVLSPVHARLTWGAAATLATFVLESWPGWTAGCGPLSQSPSETD